MLGWLGTRSPSSAPHSRAVESCPRPRQQSSGSLSFVTSMRLRSEPYLRPYRRSTTSDATSTQGRGDPDVTSETPSGTAVMTYRSAVAAAIEDAMIADESVILMGEDVASRAASSRPRSVSSSDSGQAASSTRRSARTAFSEWRSAWR